MNNTMKCIYIESRGAEPRLTDIPIPSVQSGQLLIKVEYAPLNPSDINFILGNYPSQKTFPCVPGFEGCGTVVLGSGVQSWGMQGKRVAFYTESLFGSFAEYCVVEASYCIEIENNVQFEDAACSFVNPLSVIAMCEIAKQHEAITVINSPGASQLGRMMRRYFRQQGISVISIITKAEQQDILKQDGGEFILNSNDKDFIENLSLMARGRHAKVFFDAVGGEQTAQILKAMPQGSTVYVYGRLSGQPHSNIQPNELITQNKSIQGFWLCQWMQSKNLVSLQFYLRKLKQLNKLGLQTQIQVNLPIENFQYAIEHYKKNQSLGRVLLKMQPQKLYYSQYEQQVEEGNKQIIQSNDKAQKQEEPTIEQEQQDKSETKVIDNILKEYYDSQKEEVLIQSMQE